MAERIISPEQNINEDLDQEQNLRPSSLQDFTGQSILKENLSIAIEAAKHRNDSLDHCLFAGPPGAWKNNFSKYYCKRNGCTHSHY